MSTLWRWFRLWRDDGLFERISHGLAVVDSQSVKTTESGGPRGFDVAKKVLGHSVGAGGALFDRRFFSHADHGYPDGFAVDARGWLWASAADGIHVWSAERQRLGFVPLPETVSNLTIGGGSGRRLFIAATTRLLAIDLAA